MGDDQSDGGEHQRVGDRGEDRVNRTALDESAVLEGHGAVRGGRKEVARGFAA